MTYASRIVLQLPISDSALLEPFVEACLRDGVNLIAIVGEGCASVEDAIDDLVVGDGSDESRFVVTSSHPDELLEEVMGFAAAWAVESAADIQLVNL